MSVKTSIQWCDSTVNPTMGCDGCELWNESRKSCYAGALHRRFGGHTVGYAPLFEILTEFPGRTGEAAAWPDLVGKERRDKPWLNGLPRLIFVSDMSDALSDAISFEYLQQEIVDAALSVNGQRHHWLWLTKRPRRMVRFANHLKERSINWPVNIWPGTSITSNATISRIDALRDVGNETTTRFLSVEPQIEAIDLHAHLAGIRWVIQGGESGGRPRPFNIDWCRQVRTACHANSVAQFVKQLGSSVLSGRKLVRLANPHGGDWSEWPEDIRIREFPAILNADIPNYQR